MRLCRFKGRTKVHDACYLVDQGRLASGGELLDKLLKSGGATARGVIGKWTCILRTCHWVCRDGK